MWIWIAVVVVGIRQEWIGAWVTSGGLFLGLIGVLAISRALLRITKLDRTPQGKAVLRLTMSKSDLRWGRIGLALVIWGVLFQFAGAWLPQRMGE